MFFLSKLPNEATLDAFAQKYPEMEPSSVLACLHLLKVGSELLRRLEEHFRGEGLSLARFLALIVLEREPSHQLRCSELSEALGISKPNVTRLLDALETDGLARRRDNKEDKRSSFMAITPAGSRSLAQVLPGYYRIINRAMAPLDQPSKAKLIALLVQVVI